MELGILISFFNSISKILDKVGISHFISCVFVYNFFPVMQMKIKSGWMGKGIKYTISNTPHLNEEVPFSVFYASKYFEYKHLPKTNGKQIKSSIEAHINGTAHISRTPTQTFKFMAQSFSI